MYIILLFFLIFKCSGDSSIKSNEEESNSFLNDEEPEEIPVKPAHPIETISSNKSEFSISKSSGNMVEAKPVFQSMQNLQFINDKPYLQLNKSELNLNELFLRMGVTRNGLLQLASELVYQFHKYSLYSFPRYVLKSKTFPKRTFFKQISKSPELFKFFLIFQLSKN
jgi:hypothetical protein